MDQTCRLCNETHQRPLVLISSYRVCSLDTHLTADLNELIQQYLSISKTSLEPDASICPVCLQAIADWHSFRERCLENEKSLHHRPVTFENAILGKSEDFNYIENNIVEEESPVEDGGAGYKIEFVSDNPMDANVSEKEEIGEPYHVERLSCEAVETIDSFGESNTDGCLVRIARKDVMVRSHLKSKRGERRTRPGRKPIMKRGRQKVSEKEKSLSGLIKNRARNRACSTKQQQAYAKICPICGMTRTDMTAHMRWHNNERPYQCPYCPKIFVNSSNLRNHVNLHTREKMYKCDLCEKEFPSTTGRNKHRETHATERMYACPVCEKSFKYQASLSRHKLIHFEEPKIKCKDCDMVFLTKARLRKHTFVHLDVKPFVCDVCDRPFNRKDNLKTHLKTHEKSVSNGTEA
ncbi:zinc finger protein 888-like isoform X2 [Anopheles bellator]|uniref:zinc finger protein 888-like isoform X2 n=1 Tax=Anopheles bellator TaxID=139047 RepID=UPI002648B365|nr:zinc finger protein 888-like isoform X2 [Anopheles bellator]